MEKNMEKIRKAVSSFADALKWLGQIIIDCGIGRGVGIFLFTLGVALCAFAVGFIALHQGSTVTHVLSILMGIPFIAGGLWLRDRG